MSLKLTICETYAGKIMRKRTVRFPARFVCKQFQNDSTVIRDTVSVLKLFLFMQVTKYLHCTLLYHTLRQVSDSAFQSELFIKI